MLTPEEVIERAHNNSVDVLALTDHDTTLGLLPASKKAQELGVHFIPGIEISVTFLDRTVHIVGLNIDYNNENLNNNLDVMRAQRQDRAKEMAEKLENLGFKGAYEGAMQFVTNPSLISRTHFARFLLKNKHCENMQQVFDKYLGDGKAADVPTTWASLEQALQWIHDSGGTAVIAHPGRYKFKPAEFKSLFTNFKDLGGEAIEVITGSHTPDQFKKYAGVARQYQFLASVGSDFHEVAPGRRDLGELPPLPYNLTPVWHDWNLN